MAGAKSVTGFLQQFIKTVGGNGGLDTALGACKVHCWGDMVQDTVRSTGQRVQQ